MQYAALLSVALIAVAGVAQAQTSGYQNGSPTPSMQTQPMQHTQSQPMMNNQAMPQPMQNQAQAGGSMGSCGHTATIKDEYGFRYDTEGNRLNARGCVIAPPVTPPGAAARK